MGETLGCSVTHSLNLRYTQSNVPHTHTHRSPDTAGKVRCLIHSVQGFFFSLSAKQQELFYNVCWSCTEDRGVVVISAVGGALHTQAQADVRVDEDDVGLVQVSRKETQNKHIYKSLYPNPSELHPNLNSGHGMKQ